MPRPAGYWISRDAWDDVLELRGRSLSSIAERSGVKPSTLRTIATGHDRASLEVAHKIADGLGVHVATLFPAFDKQFEQVHDSQRKVA